MNRDVFGMITEKTIQIRNFLEDYISTEKKIHYSIASVNEKFEQVYKSHNNKAITHKNKQMEENYFIKIKNLTSYVRYTTKYILKYQKNRENALDKSQNI